MTKYILTLAIIVVSLNLGKAARVITDQDIKWWYNHSNLVVICSVNKVDTILLSHIDSLAIDSTRYAYDLIRETYYISIDSILKPASNFDYQVDTIFSQDFAINYSFTRENEEVKYEINEQGDTVVREISIDINISQVDYSDDNYFRLKSKNQHLVILSLTNNGYVIDYASELSNMEFNLIKDYQLYNENYNQASYDFVNSVCQFHFMDELKYHQLYYKPAIYKFITALEDTLSKYLTNTDLLYMKRQTENIDLDFIWRENRLDNCKVLDEKERFSNRKKIPAYSSAQIIDSKTNRPIKYEKIETPKELRQIYYFIKPIWNLDSTYVVFHSDLNEINSGSSKTYIYKKIHCCPVNRNINNKLMLILS